METVLYEKLKGIFLFSFLNFSVVYRRKLHETFVKEFVQ